MHCCRRLAAADPLAQLGQVRLRAGLAVSDQRQLPAMSPVETFAADPEKASGCPLAAKRPEIGHSAQGAGAWPAYAG